MAFSRQIHNRYTIHRVYHERRTRRRILFIADLVLRGLFMTPRDPRSNVFDLFFLFLLIPSIKSNFLPWRQCTPLEKGALYSYTVS